MTGGLGSAAVSLWVYTIRPLGPQDLTSESALWSRRIAVSDGRFEILAFGIATVGTQAQITCPTSPNYGVHELAVQDQESAETGFYDYNGVPMDLHRSVSVSAP